MRFQQVYVFSCDAHPLTRYHLSDRSHSSLHSLHLDNRFTRQILYLSPSYRAHTHHLSYLTQRGTLAHSRMGRSDGCHEF